MELLPPENGRARFRQHDSSGAIVMEVVDGAARASCDPHRGSGSNPSVAPGDVGIGARWRSGRASRLRTRGEIYNPLFRFIARFALGYNATLDKHLLALEARARAN